MATSPTVNTPPAELLVSFLQRANGQPVYFAPELLAPWRAKIQATIERLEGLIAPRAKAQRVSLARAATTAADTVHDRRHRHSYDLITAFLSADDATHVKAAELLLATLYPDKLKPIIGASYEVEAAAGPTFAKKLALPDVRDAVAALSPELPGLAAKLAAIVEAAAALGRTLAALNESYVDETGRPDSELFEARTEAQKVMSTFARVVEAVYPGETPADRAARVALIGPYLRFLAVDPPREETTDGTTGEAPAPTPT